MKSMTGYGTSEVKNKQLELTVNIRSVNSRFLDPRFHLPKEYAGFESELKKHLIKNFKRGTVDINVYRRHGTESTSVKVKIRSGLAKKWNQAYKDLAQILKMNESLNLRAIGHLPGVMHLEESNMVGATEKKTLMAQFNKALLNCDNERKREGLALKKELSQLLLQLSKSSQKMYTYRQKANAALREKLNKRLKDQGLEGKLDEQRVAQEIIIMVDKADISEEMTRLKEHIKSCQKLVSGTESVGKKLDFYTQELLREVNTVGSKSQITQLTGEVVNAKSIIERFREQVQNVE